MLSEHETQVLLDRLCIEYGFCLPPAAYDELTSNPPPDVRAFTDAVFAAEGLDPATADRRTYRVVRDMVREAFRDSDEKNPSASDISM